MAERNLNHVADSLSQVLIIRRSVVRLHTPPPKFLRNTNIAALSLVSFNAVRAAFPVYGGILMLPELPLFQEAHARHSDPATSHAAAASITNLGRTKDAILSCLALRPRTDEEIAAHFQKFVPFQVSPSGLRSRRSWLVDHGFVIDYGETVKTASGRQSTIWAVAK